MSIVQRLVKFLNLRLDVPSEVGKGAAFSFVLISAPILEEPVVEGSYVSKRPTADFLD